MIRKAAANGSPTHVITVDGDNIKIDIDAGLTKHMSYAPFNSTWVDNLVSIYCFDRFKFCDKESSSTWVTNTCYHC